MDETLLDRNRDVPRENVEAVAAARELGVKFVPCTGRGFASIGLTLEQLGLAGKAGEYVISFNGGAITENDGNRLLHYSGLPFARADMLYRRGVELGVCIHAYTLDTVYTYNLIQAERDYLGEKLPVVEVDDKDLGFLEGQDIVKVLYMDDDFAYVRSLEGRVTDLTEGISVSYSSSRYIEFNIAGTDKGSGLMKLADMMGVDPAETLAIGDHINDLPMLKAAGLSAGVANCIDEVKPACRYISKKDHHNGGVAEIIQKFVLFQSVLKSI